MNRTARDNRERQPKPVKKIEVSSSNVKSRTIVLIVALVVAVGAIGFGVYSAVKTDKGMQQIEVNTTDRNCGSEFTLYYNIGSGKTSASNEKRAITKLYSALCVKAYEMFDEYAEYEDVVSVKYISNHPNEKIQVDKTLYNAFNKMLSGTGRYIYYSMVYFYYSQIFDAESDFYAEQYDPYLNEEVKDDYMQICAYANSAEHINLRLYDDYSVELSVSEQFSEFADGSDFLTFSWLKNAFIIDYLAEELVEGGFTDGYLISKDGFVRALSNRNMSFNVFDKSDNTVYQVCTASADILSIVSLRDFPVRSSEKDIYYIYQDGTVRSRYINEFGFSLNAIPSIVGYSNGSCADVLMSIYPVWSGSAELSVASDLPNQGVNVIYTLDKEMFYTDEKLVAGEMYFNEEISYKKTLLK